MKRNERPLEVRLVAVGSTNPVKVAAARRVIHYFWPEAEVVAVQVASGVSATPWGVEDVPEARGIFLSGWAAVATRDERVYLGSGGRAPLPPSLVEAVRRGEELGPAMDRLSGQENTKHTVGSVGILTRGFVQRESQFAVALAYALVPLLHPEWWP